MTDDKPGALRLPIREPNPTFYSPVHRAVVAALADGVEILMDKLIQTWVDKHHVEVPATDPHFVDLKEQIALAIFQVEAFQKNIGAEIDIVKERDGGLYRSPVKTQELIRLIRGMKPTP